jgi:hypothetical protein
LQSIEPPADIIAVLGRSKVKRGYVFAKEYISGAQACSTWRCRTGRRRSI